MPNDLVERTDGKYEEMLGETWVAEYAEDTETGLWQVQISKHDVIEWHEPGFATLEDARRAAADYYDHTTNSEKTRLRGEPIACGGARADPLSRTPPGMRDTGSRPARCPGDRR